jgi:hypothetical protein
MTTESHPTPQSPPPSVPIGRRAVTVHSRTTGEIVSAYLWFCPACRGEEFLILDIGTADHPHIQCSFCDETYCAGGKCH